MLQKNSSRVTEGIAFFWSRLKHTFLPDRQTRLLYFEYLIYQHRVFDVKGLTTQGIYTLELSQIFVELGLLPQAVDQLTADPLSQRRDAGNGRFSIWHQLQQESTQPLVIVGPPGSGKTTLLKHIAISLAQLQPDPSLTEGYRRLPMLLVLRDQASAIAANPNFSLVDAVAQAVARWPVDVPPSWVASRLQSGDCLVMLDGLDEVADLAQRQQVMAWLQAQMAQYGRNHFIITSRPFGYQSVALPSATVLEVLAFRNPQIEQFIHSWYLANEIHSARRDDPGVRMEAKLGADDLLWRLRRTPVLLDMAVNPLLLTMIATVHRYRSSLPGRRVELYMEICEAFLGKRQRARGMTFELTAAQKQRVLQTLAFHMMQQQKREAPLAEAVQVIRPALRRVNPEMSGEQFLKLIVNTSGVLVEREAELYGFAHLTFQEYLAAVHVQDQHQEQTLIAQVEDAWWHETIRLYAAQSDATNILLACLSRRTPSIPALSLAIECLEEAREVKSELRTALKQLEDSVDHPDPTIRRTAAEVRLALRMRRLTRVDDDRAIDSHFITNAEYQVFLNERRQHGDFHQPDHWPSYEFPVTQGQMPVWGVRPADAGAFCDWLSLSISREWFYRLPRRSEIQLLHKAKGGKQTRKYHRTYWVDLTGHYIHAAFDLSRDKEMEKWLRHIEERFFDDWSRTVQQTHQPLVRDLVLTRTRSRMFTLQDLDRSLHLDSQQMPDLTRDVALAKNRRVLMRIHEIDRFLQEAMNNVQAIGVPETQVLDLEPVLAWAQELATLLAQMPYGDEAQQRARALSRQLQRAQIHGRHSYGRILQPDLWRSLSAAMSEAVMLRDVLNDAYRASRRRVRQQALTHVGELVRHLAELPKPTAHSEVQTLVWRYVDLYLDFAILEARIEGRVPAFEGILLVRERR